MTFLPPKPLLPQDDEGRESRQKQLGEARAKYQYSYGYPEGVAMVTKVPLTDTFSPLFLAKVGELDLTIVANRGASDLAELIGDAESHASFLSSTTDRAHALEPHDLKTHMTTVSHDMAKRAGGKRFESLPQFEGLFGLIDEPPIVENFLDDNRADRAFAWQRVAGPNPMLVKRVSSLPPNFPVTQKHFDAAIGGGDTLAAALGEGRAFILDYSMLDGAPNGSTGGYAKHLWAPIALFAQTKGRADGDALLPVAIQCEQTPGPSNPVVTPDRGNAWRVARTVVQIADGNLHQAEVHLAHTHLILEATILAAHRQLAECHPLHILLAPHFKFTLALNEIAQTNLIAPGGQVDHVLAATLEGSLEVVKAGVKNYRLESRNPRKELAARGVDDVECLRDYPYRDDAVLIWDAIVDWVGAYLGLYYQDDASVVADPELQAFVRELSEEGRLQGVPRVDSVESLTELASLTIFTASAQHAAVNFPQFFFMGFIPNMPGAGYANLPSLSGDVTDTEYLAMLPPADQSIRQFDVTYQLSHLRDNFLGRYPYLHFRDHRVHAPATQFRSKLESIEAVIAQRNTSRFMPYPYLLPSLIPASIHI